MFCFVSFLWTKQSGAVEACCSHNPKVPGSKPGSAITFLFFPSLVLLIFNSNFSTFLVDHWNCVLGMFDRDDQPLKREWIWRMDPVFIHLAWRNLPPERKDDQRGTKFVGGSEPLLSDQKTVFLSGNHSRMQQIEVGHRKWLLPLPLFLLLVGLVASSARSSIELQVIHLPSLLLGDLKSTPDSQRSHDRDRLSSGTAVQLAPLEFEVFQR